MTQGKTGFWSPLRSLLLLAIVMLSPGIHAQSAVPELSPHLTELFQKLAQAGLRDKSAVLEELAGSGERSVRSLFTAMSAGELYYLPDAQRMYERRSEGGVEQMIDVVSGVIHPDPASRIFEKVRVNNALRRQLNNLSSRLSLTEGEAAERLAAVTTLLDNINPRTAEILRDVARTETDRNVLDMISVGIALDELAAGNEPEKRLAAVETLKGRLENPVRNALAAVASAERVDLQAEQISDAAANALQSIESRIVFFRVIEQLMFGLSLGSILLLAAIGLAVTFGVMGVINMAHGEMLMLGAYTTYVMQQMLPGSASVSLLLSLPAAFLVAGFAGVVMQRFVIRHLEGRPLETLLATFGISLILQQTVRTVFTPLNRMVTSPEWLSGSVQINPVLSVTYNRIYILIFALLVFGLLQLVLRKTQLGLQVRAVTQNRNMARSMGIRTERVDALTFGLGTGIAGIAGVALSQLTNVGPNMGQAYIIDSFMVVVFGGVGNLIGTLIGAFSIGTVSNFLEPLTGAVVAKILVLTLVILFIQKKPTGLFPQKGRAVE